MSSNKIQPFNESTMSEAINLFLEEDSSSSDKLLKLYSRCKASSSAVISCASSNKSMLSHHNPRLGTSGLRPDMAPLRRMSMVDVAGKASSKQTQGNARSKLGHSHQYLGMKKGDVSMKSIPSPASTGVMRESSISRVTKLGAKSSKPIHATNSSNNKMAPPPSVMNFLAALNSSKAPSSDDNGKNTDPNFPSNGALKSVKTETPSPSKRSRSKRQSTNNASTISPSSPPSKRTRQVENLDIKSLEALFFVGDNIVVLVEEEGGKYPAIIKALEPGGTYEVSRYIQ